MTKKGMIVGGLLVLVVLAVVVVVASNKLATEQAATSSQIVNGEDAGADMVVVDDTSENTSDEVATDSTAMADDEVVNVTVEGKGFSFTPSTLKIPAGAKVQLTFTSTGGTHDFVVEGADIATKMVSTGQSDTIEFVAPEKPGEYTYYCGVANHRALGMVGTLTVE